MRDVNMQIGKKPYQVDERPGCRTRAVRAMQINEGTLEDSGEAGEFIVLDEALVSDEEGEAHEAIAAEQADAADAADEVWDVQDVELVYDEEEPEQPMFNLRVTVRQDPAEED